MPQREAGCKILARPIPAILFAFMAVLLILASLSQPAQSQTYSVIYNFTGKGSDGASPYGGITLDSLGNLYGTTYTGGSYGAGSVYRLSPSGSSWAYSSLYSFKAGLDGVGPGFGSLVVGSDGALFGTTEGGGNFGTAFAICACPGTESIIQRFGSGTDGAEPIGGLVRDWNGNIYGTTLLGGASGNGTVFEAKRSGHAWTESVLYSFTGGNDAINPAAAVTLDAHGKLYGTTSFGGAYGNGAVYEVSPAASGWTETVLYNFQGLDDGQYPVGGLVLGQAGVLYGTTFNGGINGGGTVYQLSPSSAGWTFSVLYSFSGVYGGPYNKLALDGKGSIYGATNADGANGHGSVFKLTPASGGWTFTDLYDFTGGVDGGLVYGSVAVDSKGNVFGTADLGGTQNQGVIFEITP